MRRIVKAAAGLAAVVGAGVVTERFVFASPHYHGPATDHFNGEHFHNLGPTAREQGSFWKWMATREPGFWPEWIDEPPGPKPEARVDGGRMRITWINHASLLIQMDSVNILTDPIWSERCAPVSFAGPKRHRAPGLRFEDLPPLDAVLVSHNHYDHCDLPTLRRLLNVRIVTPLGNAALIARGGVFSAMDLDWWQSTKISDRVTVTLVPAQHFCARAISDRNRTLWGGFVISGPSGVAYFAGDTGWGPHFSEIAARFGKPRVAMLPIGAYLPRWFMRPVHISPDEAVDAHQTLGASTSIAMHFGTFHLGDDGEAQPREDLQRAIAAKGNPRILVLQHGIGFDAPRGEP